MEKHFSFSNIDKSLFLFIFSIYLGLLILTSFQLQEAMHFVFFAFAPTGLYILFNATHLEYTSSPKYTVFGLPILLSGIYLLFAFAGVFTHTTDHFPITVMNLGASYVCSLVFFFIHRKNYSSR